MDCDKIKKGESYDCTRPLQGGAEPNVILYNRADILSYTYGSVPNQITAITLRPGASSYLFEGFGRSVSPQTEVIKLGNSQNLTKHQVGLFVFGRGQATKNNIQNVMLGNFVAVVEGTRKDQDSFEVYGINCGLTLAPGLIQNVNENNGAFALILSTPENQGEGLLQQTWYDGTSYETTRTLVYGGNYQPSIINISNLAPAAAGGTAEIITGSNFWGSGTVSDVSNVAWVNQATQVATNQTAVTVTSNTQLTFNTVALTSGQTYKLRVTTSKGIAFSIANVTIP